MKKLNIAGAALAMMLLGGITSCQNDDALAPQPGVTAQTGDQNARVTADLKLTKDGQNTIQYIKQGRDAGRLSKVSGPYQYTNYSYGDGGIEGEYWITAKTYQKSNDALLKQMIYHVKNGRCVQSQDLTNNHVLDYKYNEVGRLDQIKYLGSSTKIDFSYIYNSAAGAERLSKMIYSNANGAYKQVDFYYSIGLVPIKTDKYPLNNENTDLDKYLPIFGKLSDVLVQKVVVTPLPYTNQSQPCYKYFYDLDNNGYATFVQRIYFPIKENMEAGKQTGSSILTYSTNWQGI